MGPTGNELRQRAAAYAGYAAAVLISILFVPYVATDQPPTFLAAIIGLAIASVSTWKFNQWSSRWTKELLELGVGAAVIGGVWIFVFSLPVAVLWFAPAWLISSLAVRLASLDPSKDFEKLNKFARLCSSKLGPSFGVVARAGLRLGPATAPFLTSVFPVVLVYGVLAVELPGFAIHDHHLLAVGAASWTIFWALFCVMRPHLLGSHVAAPAPAVSAAALVGMAGGFNAAWFAWAFWSVVLVLAYHVASWWRVSDGRRQPTGESLRLFLVVAGGCLLMKGFLSRATLGSGDARWYGVMLQDMILQTRAHGFPVWTGQTPYQFNGGIYPLRVAPAFHHYGALLDSATGHILGAVGLMNLLIFTVGVTAALVAYYCASTIAPGRRWTGALLALIYLACPGVVGVAYNTDLYMSWMTVPFVPLAFAAAYANFREPRRIPTLVMSAALGMCWWGHSPIALWTTSSVALVQLCSVVLRRPDRQGWTTLFLGAALFICVAAYPIGSVLVFPPEPGVNAAGFQRATAGTISFFLHKVFPQVLLPVIKKGEVLSNFQLGYTLWILLIAGLASVRRGLDRGAADILGISVGLVALLTPVAFCHDGLWTYVPAFFRNTTANWVMNRLYVVLASSVVVASAVMLRSLSERARRVALGLLVVGTAWSLSEASKFSPYRASQIGGSDEAAMIMKPENILITRYAYLVFPVLPATFSDGVVAPELEYRMLDRSSLAALSDGLGAAAASAQPVADVQLPANDYEGMLIADSPLHLAGGHRYLLQLQLNGHDSNPAGVLQLQGPSLFRANALPAFGGDLAFGYGDSHSPYMPVWTSNPMGEDVHMIFVPQDMTPAQADHFAHIRLLDYDPRLVPVQVTGWMPYQASIHAETPSWFESPRIFQTGYVATVDGSPAEVRKSPIGLVMVAVPKGHSSLVLTYKAPFGLQALFWSSVTAVGLSLVLGARLLAGRRPAALAS